MRVLLTLAILAMLLIGSSGCTESNTTDGVTPPAGGTPPAAGGVQQKDQGPQGEG